MNNQSRKKRLEQIIIQIIAEKKPQTVKQLASLVKEKTPISEEEIIDSILSLQSEGKIKITKQPVATSRKMKVYLKTQEALWYWVTLTITSITTVVVFAIPEDFYPLIYMRYVLGTIFVLWLPGYTFIKALFPIEPSLKTSSRSLDSVERIVLSLGMSLALVPLVGLLLNYTPWGISLTSIVSSLLALSIVFATVAVVREHQTRIKTAP